MSNVALPALIRQRPGLWITLTLLSGLVVWLLFTIPEQLDGRARISLHWPHWALLAQQPAMIQVHIAAAAFSFLLGLAMFARLKGDALHKALGWTWVGAMFLTAASSLFIVQLNHGAFSFIHLISGWTLVALPMAVYAARRRRIASHRRAMTSLFLGGLVIAGALTFIPGRLMWRVFVG